MKRKALIEHFSQNKSANSIQKIGERSMVLVNAEMTLNQGKWKNIAEVVTFALENTFGEEVE